MRAINPKSIRWLILGGAMMIGAMEIEAAPAPHARPVDDPTAASDKTDDSTFENVEIVDSRLKGKLAVVRVGTDYTDDEKLSRNKPLSIFAGFRNRTDHKLVLEIQTIYKDKDDATLNKGSWIPMTLKPHEEKDYHSSAITMDATDFLVRVRHAPASGVSSDK